MDKLKGLHFYINVVNFNEVVLDEESKSGKVNHSIHATVQTPGFMEFNKDSELVICYPNGANIQFEFSGKADIL